MGAPVLEGEKAGFALRRVLQTLLGGLELFPGTHAALPVLLQLLLFALPLALALPAALVSDALFPEPFAASSADSASASSASLAYTTAVAAACAAAGGAALLATLVAQIVGAHIANSGVTTLGTNQSLDDVLGALGDDGRVQFPQGFREGFCGSVTCGFVFPTGGVLRTILASLTAGILCAGAVHYHAPSHFAHAVGMEQGGGSAAAVAWQVFSWLAFLVSAHSAVVRPPVEPTRAAGVVSAKLEMLSRPVYTMAIFAIDVAARWAPSLAGANLALHWVHVFLPIGWVLGVIPQFHTLFEWAVEQLHVRALGGTAYATKGRLVRGAIGSIFSFAITFFLVSYVSVPLALGFAAAAGFFLSGNSTLASKGTRRLAVKITIEVFGAAALGGAVGALSLLGGTLLGSAAEASFRIAFAALLSVIAGGGLLLVQLKRPFFLNLFRNVLFKSAGFQRAISVTLFWGLGFAPFLWLVFSAIVINEVVASNPMTNLSVDWWRCALFVRAMRWPWQSPSSCAVELAVASLLRLAPSTSVLRTTYPEVLFFLVSLGVNRGQDLCGKLYFVAVYSTTAIAQKKLRFAPVAVMCLLELFVFMPLSLVSAVLASALEAPLVPVLGLPLFAPGFPRTQRFWPELAATDPPEVGDNVYYKQLVPRVLDQMQGTLRSGGCGAKIAQFLGASTTSRLGVFGVGDLLVLRVETRLAFVSVVEKGRGYAILAIQGLELRPTSCHNIEGHVLDDLFASAFGEAVGDALPPPAATPINRFALHAVSPLEKLTPRAYTVSKILLTGIIEHPDTLKRIDELFWQALLWQLREKLVHSPDFVSRHFGELPLEQPDDEGPASAAVDELGFPRLWCTFLFGEAPSTLGTLATATPRSLKEAIETADVAGSSSSRALLEDALRPLRELSVACYSVVQRAGLAGISPVLAGAGHALRCFHGDLPPSPELAWFKVRPELLGLVIKSYRVAFKLAVDYVAEGATEQPSFEELAQQMEEIEKGWFLGSTSTPEWAAAVSGETRARMLGITREHTGGGTANDISGGPWTAGTSASAASVAPASAFSLVSLSLRQLPVCVGSASWEVTRGLWAGLAIELLYVTNDDDERYSVQAHPQLFRNIAIQHAEQPLGYPAYDALSVIPRLIKRNIIVPL